MAKGITVPVTQTGLEQSIQGAIKQVGKVNIPIDVDAKSFKNLSQPLGRITGLATEFEKSIAASNARVIAFGASVGIINGVQNALAGLVTTTIEVQKNLTNIGVIFGKTNEELGSFSKGLFAVARETAQSFQTASEAALEFSRQGLSVEETLKRTKDALTLTRFTSLSAADAVDVLTAAVNSFSSSGVTTSDILNKLVAVDTKFAVSSEDLAKGLSRAGSIAQEVGVSLDQLNGIITVVQEKTARGGAVIGNAFKTIFTRIRSDETIKALQEIGIFSRDASGNLRPVVDILTQLAGKLNSLSEVEKIGVLEAVASKYNINSLNSLLDDLSSSSSKFQEIAGISATANNEAYARQVELNKTLDATIKQTVVSVSELANSIGKIGVTANLQSLLEFFNDIVSGINSFIDSESIGGDIAKGLISGISGVLFKIGLPILAAIFIKLTKDIAQFGVESLKTILGINQQVKERQALEQAVVNTLIRDRDVMAAILALSGDRAKQEQYLLNLYNRQIAALQQVQSIAGAVAPGLVQAGLSATSGSVQRKAGRAAEGYLPAQEAADVKRGVGGADKSAKVVKIPNFSFGGGKKGTMYANSSEYIVPNYNGGDGAAIFNKDMVRKYGMPENAKKINAANGYIPNFADGKYIYDSDKLPADKNALLKKILASKVKKNLILGPAGTGKTTFAAAGGTFITKPEDADKATEIDILSGAARTKDGGISANLESIISAVNLSGGKVSYLYAGNMDIIARRIGREEKGVGEGDLRSEKQIAGTKYAPLNQFDFIDKVKSKAKNFGIVKNAATGYIPNFAQKAQVQTSEAQKEQSDSITIADARGRSAMLVPDKKNEQIMEAYLNEPLSFGFQTKEKGKKFGVDYVKYHTYGLNQEAFQSEGLKKSGDLTNIEADVQAFGLDIAKKYSYEYAAEYSKSLGGPATGIQISDADVRKAFLASKGAVSGFSSLGGGIFETAIRTGVQGEINKDLLKAQQAELGSGKLDFKVTDIIKRLFGVNRGETDADSKIEGNPKSTGRAFADQIAANKLYSSTSKVAIKNAAAGYIPNFAKAKAKKTGIGGLQGKRQKFDFEKNVEGFASSDDGEEKTAPSILGGRVFESRLNNKIEMNLTENKVKPDVTNASFINWRTKGSAEAEAKLSVAAGLRDKRLGIPVSKGGKGNKLIVPTDAAITENLNKSLQSKNIEAQKASGPKFSTQSIFKAAEDTIAIWENVDRDRVPYKNIKIPKQGDVDKVVKQYVEFTTEPQEKGAKFFPSYAEKLSEMYDWDGTIIPKISGKSEEYIQSLQKLQATDLLPIGKELAASKAEFDIATIRPIAFKDSIRQTAQRLGLKVDKVFPVGSMFDSRRTQGKRGERKLYGPERKALLAEGTGRSIVDDEEANLAALGSRGINANLRNRASFGFIPNFAEGLKQQDVLAPSGQFYDLDTADAFLAGSSVNIDPASPAGKGLGQELKKKILASARRVYGPKAQIGISRLPGQREAFTSAVLANPALADDFIALQKATTGGVGPAANTPDALAKFNNPTPFDPTPWPAIRATGGKARTVKKVGPASLTAAFGFVPNFADPLQEAVDREISAGIKPSQVRITQDDRLITTRNPEGIAVINTKDEPNGKVPSNRINEKDGRKAAVAMAAKGFIPNFAEDPKIDFSRPKGMDSADYKRLKAELDKQIAILQARNASELEIVNLAKNLGTQFNLSASALSSLEQSAKKLARDMAKMKLPQGTVLDAKGNAVAAPKNLVSKDPTANANDALGDFQLKIKKFDAGKFLLMQSAIVGATSALQAFTEENSNAALSIEAFGGVASGVSTGLSLAAAGLNPFVAIIGGAVAASTSLIPVFIKMGDKFETETERIQKSLVKLADQAEKTGEAITPEAFLAALEKGQKEAKVKTESISVRDQITGAIQGLNLAVSDENIKKISTAVQASGGVQEGKLTQQGQKTLIEILQKNTQIYSGTSASDAGDSRTEAKVLNVEKIIEEYKLKALAEREKKEKEIGSAKIEAELKRDNIARKLIQFENEKLLEKLRIEQSIFDLQLRTTAQFFDRTNQLQEQYNNLERQKSSMSEIAYITAKAELDRKKIREETLNEEAKAAVKLKETFSRLPSPLGNVLGGMDVEQLKKVIAELAKFNDIKGFSTRQVDVSSKSLQVPFSPLKQAQVSKGFSYAEQAAAFLPAPMPLGTGPLRRNQGEGVVDLLRQQGSKTGVQVPIQTLNSLSPVERTDLLRGGREFGQAIQGISETARQASVTLETGLIQSLNTTSIGQLEGEINGVKKALKGEGYYTQKLTLAKQALEKSVLDLQLKNKLEADSVGEFIQAEEGKFKADLEHIEIMRSKFPIAKRAALSEQALNVETERKLDTINVEIATTGERLRQERRITYANNQKLKAENDAYNTVVKNTNISLKLTEAREKLRKSENEAEEQNQVAIAMVRKNFDADLRGLDRKIELAKAMNKQLKQADYDILVSKELSLEKENLIAAQRKAVAEFNNLGGVIQNYQTSFSIDQTKQLTSSIREGAAFTELGIGAGTLEKQAISAVQRERIGKRRIEDVSEAEKYEIISGRNNSIRQNLQVQRGVLLDQAQEFQDIIGKQTPQLFADGMAEAMQAALSGADDLESSLRNIALNFLKNLQSAFLQSATRQIVASMLPSPVSGSTSAAPLAISAASSIFSGTNKTTNKTNFSVQDQPYNVLMNGFNSAANLGSYSDIGLEKYFPATAQAFAARSAALSASTTNQSNVGFTRGELNEIKSFVSPSVSQGAKNLADMKKTTFDMSAPNSTPSISASAPETLTASNKPVPVVLETGSEALKLDITASSGSSSMFVEGIGALFKGSFNFLSKFFEGQPYPKDGSGLLFNSGGFVKAYASGGFVTGGSGYKDDVPAMLTHGEYVIRKSAVEKYGAQNLAKLNSGQEPPKFAMGGYVPRFAAGGDIFLPGVRGGTAISGYKDLTRFANQTTTSGSTDVMKGSGSSAFINLEDQSMRLSRFALLNEDDTINQEVRSAQQQGLDLIKQREAYRTQQRKALQQQIIQTAASAALSFGVGKLANINFGASKPTGTTVPYRGSTNTYLSNLNTSRGSAMLTAYGGMIKAYADGGPVDKTPALLMDGEYVMSNKAVKKHGKQFFDSLNQGRAPRFANGGEVGAGGEMLGEKFDNLSSKLETRGAPEVNITVNVTNSGSSETKSQGESAQGGIDYKKMSEKIKAVVLETINEEKRLGGSLRPRN